MRKRVNVFAAVLLMLTLAACGKKSANSSENQPSNATNQQASTNPPAPPTAAAPAPAQPAPAERVPAQPVPNPPPTPAPPPKPVVLPAGATVTVKVAETINTKTAKPGGVFTATTATPIHVGGKTVIPAGSPVEGVVVESKSPGKFKGEGTLSVKLTSITVNGVPYKINTAPDTLTQKGKGKRTAVVTGGSAAGGALIGGLAGGGKGAAIGGLLGAGGGAAGSALTGNKELEIPAESALSFKLQQSLTIAPHSGTKAEETANRE
jgi:hypothetical protein